MSGIDLEDLKNKYHVAISSLDNRYFSDSHTGVFPGRGAGTIYGLYESIYG